MEKTKRKPRGVNANPEFSLALGARVRQRRIELGMTQFAATVASGMGNSQAIHLIELGRQLPSAITILGLCRGLRMSPNQILGWEEPVS